jgi:phytoene desaturase
MVSPNGNRASPESAPPSGQRVIVIGGGLAGLAAAVEIRALSKGSVDVTLIEKNAHLGGKMNVFSEQGFSFDMGPTIITLPQVLRGIIRRAGKKPEDYLTLVNLDPQWRCHYEDGTVIDLRPEPAEMARALDRQFPNDRPGEGYMRFVDFSRRMMRLSEKVFFYKDLGGVSDLMFKVPKNVEGGQAGLLKDVAAMRMHSTVGATAHKHIREPHVQQMVEHFMQYVGSSPFLAPAILSLIASAQVDHGCWYPLGPNNTPGGTRMVARTVATLARELGVNLVLGTGVRKILTEGSRVTGVECDDGRRFNADAIVSNCDVQRTYRDLIGTGPALSARDKIANKYTPACSGVVLYLGLDRRYDHLAHHNFLFSRNSQEEFHDIYAAGIPARDPTLYLAVPSRTDSGQAPEGGEALYVLVHTPYIREGQKWDGPGGLMEKYRPVIIDKLKRFGMPDLEQHIKVDRTLSPAGIEKMYNAEGGAIYGLASHGRLHGGFKPRNRSDSFKGLYLAGGSANPGPGVPMVLMSGVTAGRSVCEDLGVNVPEIVLGPGVEGPQDAPRLAATSLVTV